MTLPSPLPAFPSPRFCPHVPSPLPASAQIKNHNMAGTGNILGGLLVVGKDGEVAFTHVERELGMAAEHEDVRSAVRKVTAAA
eukprot:366222-Chlamydomonas_euryale.AAC.15